MRQIKSKELKPLAHFINDQYAGDLFAISRYLDNAVYMLRFVSEDDFDTRDVQNVCFVLNKIKEGLYQAHQQRHLKQAS